MRAAFPALAMVAAYFLLQGYKLHGRRLAEVQGQVAALHARKKGKIINGELLNS